MKAYVNEYELWPAYSVSTKEDSIGATIDVPEEKILEWKETIKNFHQAQREIEIALRQYEFKQDELRHLRFSFAREKPSRTDKGYLLSKFGWVQTDTSVWEKDGRSLRLHEAYDECKRNFEAINQE